MYGRNEVDLEAVTDESARPLLSRNLRKALGRLLPLLAAEAQRRQVPVSRVRISGYVDPEEVFRQIVVRQWVDLSPEQAADYWDELEDAVEAWTAQLPPSLAQLMVEQQISLSVLPSHDDIAA